jgi:two-component system LytT family response regulator
LEEIRYLKADGAYTHIHFTNNQRLTVTKTLQEYNILEETGSFFRVNRSYILNVHCIAKISKKDGGFVVMDNGEEISASLEKRNQLYNFFRDNIF